MSTDHVRNVYNISEIKNSFEELFVGIFHIVNIEAFYYCVLALNGVKK